MSQIEKITISLPRQSVRTAKRAVRRRGGSVSSYIATALAAYENEDELKTLLDELDRELGRPSPAAEKWAEKALR